MRSYGTDCVKYAFSALAIAGALVGLTMTNESAQAGERSDAQATIEYGSFEHRMPPAGGRQTELTQRMLATHNAERSRLGLPALRWNDRLANDAANWGRELTYKGYLQHADNRTLRETGENLWMGTSGYWNVEEMIGMFLEERKYYRHAAFPNVSNTGNWTDVGHYTQIIWRDTREVGCAVVTGKGNDVLVCRYFPGGNVRGARAY